MHVDTQTVMSDSNEVAAKAVFIHISVVLNGTDAQYAANCRLMDQFLRQFLSEVVQSSGHESMDFNHWWEGSRLLGYCFLTILPENGRLPLTNLLL